MSPDDSAARVPLGPIGRYVLSNVRELRQARGLTYRELSNRLSELGREIPALGLSRIEKGTRRVDADDLVALAIALGVNPTALLLPRDTLSESEIKLTETEPTFAAAAWGWADGRAPMLPGIVTDQDRADFMKHARPVWARGGTGQPKPDFATEHQIASLQEQLDELKGLWRANHREKEDDRLATAARDRALLGPPGRGERSQAVVAAIVTSDRGVLVTRRVDQNPPWGFTAGWGEPGESHEDTIIREVKEEADLRIQVGEYLGERDHPDTGKHMIYYAARPTHGTEIHLGDKGELTEVRWVSLAEADELLPGMFEPVREHLARELGEG
jgi:8-oxo-dGTP pyrophosphatase MutT (NUDIX family)/transcriptional regulator with XRE-family HTH domain